MTEIDYDSKERAGLGIRFQKSVENAVARDLAFPLSGSQRARNARRVLAKSFPFAVVYRIELTGILVVAVAHQSREPNYWLSRVA